MQEYTRVLYVHKDIHMNDRTVTFVDVEEFISFLPFAHEFYSGLLQHFPTIYAAFQTVFLYPS